MNYSFHPHADKELEEIESHYETIREELSDRFRAEIELTDLANYQFTGRTGSET